MPTFNAQIANGKLEITDKAAFEAWQKKAREGEVSVIIRRKGERLRSIAENNYYWGVVVDLLCEHTGDTPDDMHEILKEKFLRETKFLQGEGDKVAEVARVQSTTLLTTHEFEDYLKEVREWASIELGIYIPLPNEQPL
jgi:hypothetical protein